MVSTSFFVFRSSICKSSLCQLTIPKLYLSTGTANDPIACILFFATNSDPKLVPISSRIPSSAFLSHSYAICQNSLLCLNTYAFLVSSTVTSFSNVFRICLLLWTLPLLKHIFAYFSKQKYYYYLSLPELLS